MKTLDTHTAAFLGLLRAGLWEQEVRLSTPGTSSATQQVDFEKVRRVAEEQSVTGVVAAGLERVTDGRAPKADALAFAAAALQIEQRNAAMNRFVAELTERLRAAGIAFALVKGQGVAQCYARPLWRACGDIDLLLDAANYAKAKALLEPLAQEVEPEDQGVLHQGLELDGWLVELHGTLRSGTLPRMDRVIDEAQRAVLAGGDVRLWRNGAVDVPLPGPDSDVVLVFTHLVKHFALGGIGLRQVCDWCRLLWTFRDTLDVELLEQRLRRAGVMREWRAFAALAVTYLGMPAEALPLYAPHARWSAKADRVLARILALGNFGRNRDVSYQRYPRLLRKAISFCRHTTDCAQVFAVSPRNAATVWWHMLVRGIFHIFV